METSSQQTAASAIQSAIFAFSEKNWKYLACSRVMFDERAPENLSFGRWKLINTRFSLLRTAPVPFGTIVPKKTIRQIIAFQRKSGSPLPRRAKAPCHNSAPKSSDLYRHLIYSALGEIVVGFGNSSCRTVLELTVEGHSHAQGIQAVATGCWPESARDGCSPQGQPAKGRLP